MQGRAGEWWRRGTRSTRRWPDPALPESGSPAVRVAGHAQGNFRGDLDLAEATAKTRSRGPSRQRPVRDGLRAALHGLVERPAPGQRRQAALIDRALRVLGDDRDHVHSG
jgi:hypothetical protein